MDSHSVLAKNVVGTDSFIFLIVLLSNCDPMHCYGLPYDIWGIGDYSFGLLLAMRRVMERHGDGASMQAWNYFTHVRSLMQLQRDSNWERLLTCIVAWNSILFV